MTDTYSEYLSPRYSLQVHGNASAAWRCCVELDTAGDGAFLRWREGDDDVSSFVGRHTNALSAALEQWRGHRSIRGQGQHSPADVLQNQVRHHGPTDSIAFEDQG